MKSTGKQGLLAGLFVVAFCALLAAPRAWAQGAGTAAMSGTVQDQKGLVIVGATVVVKNVDTGLERTLQTNDVGLYSAPFLQPGNYEVRAKKEEFAEVIRKNLRLEVGQTLVIDIKLPVKTAEQVVTVTTEAPVTEPEKIGVSDTVTQLEVETLPTNGRRWDNFVLLTPGVTMDGTFGIISSRGISGLLNNNMVDGADNNQAFFSEARGRTRTAYTYSQAAVKEFQVGLSNFSAEFGRAAGGTVNAVTKSGTSAWHGEVFYYVRDDALQAREPTLFGQPAPGEAIGPPLKNKDRRQQYGLSLGGPIMRDKLFFFGNFDQQLRTETYLVRPDGRYFQDFLVNPTTAAAGCLQGSATPDPRLVTNCNALLQAQRNEAVQQPRKRRNNVALGKLDWQVTPNHTITGSYNWHRWNAPNTIQTQQVLSRGLTDNGTDIVKTDVFIAKWVGILGPRVVNETKFQFGRDFEEQTPNADLPRTTITNGISFGRSEFLPRPAWPDEMRYQWTDTVSFFSGRHGWKFGLDINYVRGNSINIFNGGGIYAYSGSGALSSLAQDCPPAARALGCVPFALPNTTLGKHWSSFTQAFDIRQGRGTGNLFLTTTDFNFFVQDTFKWRPTVTINYGLRYEFQRLPEVRPVNVNNQAVFGFPDQPWTPETQTINQDTNNFGPRLSIAWDIGGRQKNVIRTGGGIFYGRTPNALLRSHLLENGVALPSFALSGSVASQRAAGPVYPDVLSASPGALTGARTVLFMADDFVRPIVYMADVAYEREITRNIGISFTYLFTRANRLVRGEDINLNAPTSTITYFLDADGSDTTRGDRTMLGEVPFYAGQRPFCDTLVAPASPTCTRLGAVVRQVSDLNAAYHGFVVQYTQRARFGLTVNTNFTLSKAEDDGQSMGASPFAARFPTFFDPNNQAQEYTRSDFDQRRRFVASYIWEPERVWKTSGAVRHVLGNWALAGIVTIQDGQPMNPTISGFLSGGANTSGTTQCGSTGTCAAATGSSNGSGGSLRPGWLPRNYIETTGFVNFDFRVQKDFRITETKSIRFLWEVFNAFNRSNHPNRFNFSGTGFNIGIAPIPPATSVASSCAQVVVQPNCVSTSANPDPNVINPNNLAAPRVVILTQNQTYRGIMDPLTGQGDLQQCQVSSCLSSASGVLFGARDMQFGLKFVF